MIVPSVKALLPMKEDSERIPKKNYKILNGKPLFHWILNSLTNSKYIDEIIINTDSDLIAKDVSENFSATILHRPKYLLGRVGIRKLIEYDLNNSDGNYYLQTHCTNPLLKSSTIDNAIESFFSQSKCDSLFSVTPIQTRFYGTDMKALNHDPKNPNLRTQDLDPVYEENSCMYLFSKKLFFNKYHRIGDNPLLYIMDKKESVDIDEPIDFSLAELLMKNQ